jgi:hypothetical protein
MTDQIKLKLGETMDTRGSFRVGEVSLWLYNAFGVERANNIEAILAKARKEKLECDYLCHGTVFRSGSSFGIVLSMYPLDPELYTSYYYRDFSSINSFSRRAVEIVEEMENRLNKEKAEEVTLNKTLYIEKFNVQLKLYTQPTSGEEMLIPTDFLPVNGVDYNVADHFFDALFAYNFHVSRLFDLRINNYDGYVINNPVAGKDIDFVVSTDILATSKISLLRFVLTDNKGYIETYDYPFASLSMQALNEALRRNALIITSKILNYEETKEIGIININAGSPETKVFYKDYYLGRGNQMNLLLPFGLNEIMIGSRTYTKFVLPLSFSKYSGDEDLVPTDLLEDLR